MARLSDSDRAILRRVIRYIDNNSAGRNAVDQFVSDQLARVFRSTCGFMCGCPGTFQVDLMQSPSSTLLRVFLCIADSDIADSDRNTIQWVINYLERGSVGDGDLDQRIIDRLVGVFQNTCGFSGNLRDNLRDSPASVFLRAVMCFSEPAPTDPVIVFIDPCDSVIDWGGLSGPIVCFEDLGAFAGPVMEFEDWGNV